MASAKDLDLKGPDGSVAAKLFPAAGSRAAVVLVGGAGGGWDSPARGLYPVLCEALPAGGVSALRVRFRDPHDLLGAVEDVLVGMRFLLEQGALDVGLVGHSFGGAVVVRAAVASPEAKSVVCLAPQSYGADVAKDLRPQTRLLLVHGEQDDVLPPACARQIAQWAPRQSRLVLLPGNGHGLDESADEVHRLVLGFLLESLRPAPAQEHAPRAT